MLVTKWYYTYWQYQFDTQLNGSSNMVLNDLLVPIQYSSESHQYGTKIFASANMELKYLLVPIW
jgi:hypothetical protein